MTDHPTDSADDPRRRSDEPATEAELARALRRARWAILWERLWPALAMLATAAGAFLAVSWAGLWLALPATGRAIGLFVFLVVFAAAAVPLVRLRPPTVYDSLRRLDRGTGVPHRPATAIADELAAGGGDHVSQALWRAHIERALRAAGALRTGLPRPRLALIDPIAIRALVLLLVVATFFGAAGERGKRIVAAFDWAGVVAVANFRIDAWVTPPPYTGRPPVLLPGIRPGEPVPTAAGQVVPAGSVLVVRATGTTLDVATSGGLAEAPTDGAAPAVPTGSEERRFVVRDRGTATVRGVVDDDVTWTFVAIPDKSPVVTLVDPPEPQARGALKLAYKLEDDYGVVGAQATFAAKAARADARPLYGPPDFPLVLPQARTRNAAGRTTKDLAAHPWAGVDVAMTLVARDEAGNEGRSSPHEFRLPQRAFGKPLARALVEQRRLLALDADARDRVQIALDALTIAPEKFIPETSIYLGLRAVYWQLARARTDDELRGVVERLWSMAVTIEDGNVSDAEAALRAAQERLREALERGAGEEEIRKLTDELRAALDKFLQALAEELRKNPQQLARPLDRNTRVMRPQDLKNMIDRLENLARSGAKDAARRLLDELQSMLDNLQTARPGQAPDGADDDMAALDELGDMIRKQQQLRDRTFRQGQEQRRGDGQRGQKGQKGRQGEQGRNDEFGDLQQNQQALRDQLKRLMEELKKRGLGQQRPGQQDQAGEGLGQAEEAMRGAEGALGEGDADGAVGSQGRALEALRKGAQGLAQQLQQGDGQDQGPGPGQPGRGRARADQNTDPLGRPLRGREYGDDSAVRVPGEIDVQRARRILEELRKRFGETMRPQIELDYIERLLKDF